jgi:hypothetical protein
MAGAPARRYLACIVHLPEVVAMIAPRVVSTAQLGKRTATFPAGKTREDVIRDAAYLLAERRGFAPGKELDDWLAAERQVRAAARSAVCRFGRSG